MSELLAMKTLLVLRDCNSLTQAARQMDEPKSTLSRRLAILEGQLGQPLTCQNGRCLSLTPAGRCYAGYAEQILQLADEGRQALLDMKKEPSGDLCIGLCQALSRGWSTDTLNQFSQEYPGINLKIRILEDVEYDKESKVDLWITCCGHSIGSGFKPRLLGRWEQGLYAADFINEEEVMASLDAFRWICEPEVKDEIWLQAFDSRNSIKVRISESLKINSLHMRADAIAMGHGIGLLPCWVAECHRHGLPRLKRVLPTFQGDEVMLSIQYHAGRKTAAVVALQQWLIEHIPPRWSIDSER
jgi:DNA-binding transcriptional LysR family regulator